MTTWIIVAEASVSKHHMYSVYKCMIHFGVFLKTTCSTLPNKVFHKCSCLISAEKYICNRITTTVIIEYLVKTTNKAMADRIRRGMQTIYSHLAYNHPSVVIHDEHVISILCARIMTYKYTVQ